MGKISFARRINLGIGELNKYFVGENGTEMKHFTRSIGLEHENVFDIILRESQLVQKEALKEIESLWFICNPWDY